MTQLVMIDTDAIADKVERAVRGHNPCVLTAQEFEDLLAFSPLKVIHRATGIWQELGVLGYIGRTLLYDASKWNTHPFEHNEKAFLQES